MRILWIQRRATDEDGGDSVYDKKLQGALASSHEVTTYALTRNSRLHQLASAAIRFAPPEQYGFGNRQDVDNVRRLLTQGFDAIVFSHEHLDAFASAIRPTTQLPFVALRHNVSSDAMASILVDRPMLSCLYGALARAQEGKALRGDLYDAITAISTRDQDLLRDISGNADVGLVLPGPPPATPLKDTSACARDIIVSGTFDWFPKARDLKRFANEWAAAPVPDARVYVSPGVPDGIRETLRAGAEDSLDYSGAIRFGVITDRFTAGHKLKTAAYLMRNCAVITFAPVIHDFTDFPDAPRWIHHVSSMAEVASVIRAIEERPAADLCRELAQLKADVGTRFAWAVQANALSATIERARQQRSPAAVA